VAATVDTFLSVEDLKVHFPTPDGLVKATDGLSFKLARGKTLGIVGESGSGKSVSSSAIMGLHRDTTAKVSGEILLDGVDLLTISDEEMRLRRGKEIAMIFQDPLSAMHPYYTVGNQIAEAYRMHHDVGKRAARKRVIEMLDLVGIPQPDRRVDDYAHQFSRDDRDGAHQRPEPGDCGRTHHRARRDGAGTDPRPAADAAAGVQHRDHPHHP
jgi:peptide/nickel transport system ATP-binding protein